MAFQYQSSYLIVQEVIKFSLMQHSCFMKNSYFIILGFTKYLYFQLPLIHKYQVILAIAIIIIIIVIIKIIMEVITFKYLLLVFVLEQVHHHLVNLINYYCYYFMQEEVINIIKEVNTIKEVFVKAFMY